MKGARRKILLTGGAGYVGSHTVRYLLKLGYHPSQLIVFDNLRRGHRNSLPAGVRIIKGDLLNKSSINEVFRTKNISSVIHFAAYAYVGESIENPELYYKNNILGGLNLLEAMRQNSCREIVFSSTCAVFGASRSRKISERAPKIPSSPYGHSKLIFEELLEWYGKLFSIKFVILRYFNAAGAGLGIGEDHNPETHLIPLVIRAARGDMPRRRLKIYGGDYSTRDGTCIRDYVHVLDLAEAHRLALDYLTRTNSPSESFNLGRGEGTSVLQVIKLVERISGRKVPYEVTSRRAGDPAHLVADPSKAKLDLKWVAKRGILQILSDAYTWEEKKKKARKNNAK